MEEVKKQTPEEMVKQADEQFLAWMKNGRYAELIATMPTLGRYSLRNQMLILSQNPKATDVNGMNAWNYQKRHVKAGEKSLKILAPKFASTVTTNPDGSFTEKTSEKATGYEVNFVFDVSQTEGEPKRDVFADEQTAIERYDIVSEALKGTVKGFEFKSHDTADNESNGLLDTQDGTISLRSDLSKNDTLYTLVNQVAAAIVLTRDRRNFKGLYSSECENISAVEASAVTKAVASRLGLKTYGLVEPQFADLSDDKISKFAENVGVIRSVSQRMITAAESAVAKAVYEETAAKAKSAENAEPHPEVTDVKPKTAETVKKPKQMQKTKAEAAMV